MNAIDLRKVNMLGFKKNINIILSIIKSAQKGKSFPLFWNNSPYLMQNQKPNLYYKAGRTAERIKGQASWKGEREYNKHDLISLISSC